jgi:hypothetical protein
VLKKYFIRSSTISSAIRQLPGTRTTVDAGQLMNVSDALLKDKLITREELDDMKHRSLPVSPAGRCCIVGV